MNKITFINGILDILFIISLFVSIKIPIALRFSLAIASAAIVVNVADVKQNKLK